MAFFFRYLAAIALVLAAGLLLFRYVSPATGLWWLAAAFALQSVLSAIHMARAHHWMALPSKREPPGGIGPWQGIFDRLSRFVRQEADARAELSAELEQIHAAVDCLADGLVVLDRFDHIVWSNLAAEELHGIYGTRRPIHHFIRQPEFVAMLAAGESPGPIRLSLASRPGRIYELSLQGAADKQRLLVSHDVTEQVRLDAMRTDFVTSVSHEIHDPVVAIASTAATLLASRLDEADRRQGLESIRQQSVRMERLVEDLLTLSMLEADIARPADEAVDFHELLRDLLEEARAVSEGRHEIGLAIEGPRRLIGIAAELRTAARNLLRNAIRYTPEGGTVAASWTLRGNEAWFSVRDTGIGIAAEHLPRLTERFYRVDPDRSRETGGTGLGLAIVRHIMIRHGGSLHIGSEPGKGSTFSLRFPEARLLPG